jgi:hypothetical protein
MPLRRQLYSEGESLSLPRLGKHRAALITG